MPRYRRTIAAGSVQHVVSRFVNREFRFDAPDARSEYLRRAGEIFPRTDWRTLGYALMSSHVHWVMHAGTRASAALIKPLHAGFAGWLNHAQQRLGPVFADRHRTLTFDGETAAALLAYIHNNPVRAGVVNDPADSSWTSHRAYLGLAPAPPWLNVELGLELCGFSATQSGRVRFHEMVVARSRDAKQIELSGGDMEARRRSLRARVAAPVEIASPRVSLEDGALRVDPAYDQLNLRELHRLPMWCGEAGDVLQSVAGETGAELRLLKSRARGRGVVQARRLALVTWTLELQRPARELASVLGITSSSASELIGSASPSIRATAAALATKLRT